MLKVYNTKTRTKEEFTPLSSRQVKVYYCGPTVYNFAHIGNLRSFVFEDIVVKSLKFLGYDVHTTMNITDVDDKTIRDSQKAGEDLRSFTRKYTKIFLEDIEKLGIEKADNVVPVTTLIPEMVRMINTMLRRGYAYLSDDGSVYYDISAFKKYGQLAHLDMSGMKVGARVNNDEYDKESASDFALWKAWTSEDGDNFWEEEFEVPNNLPLDIKGVPEEGGIGQKVIIKGRPGWHIECSACNMKYFGPQIDIHMGGCDLIFPHHQNEIAQTEACTKKEFCQYWLHSGHLMVEGKKMSKSLGNFYTLEDIEKFADEGKIEVKNRDTLYRAIRLSFINGKYKDSIDFSFDKLGASIQTIGGIDEMVKVVEREKGTVKSSEVSIEFREYMQEIINRYIETLEDDFNIPEALAVFF